MKQEAKSIAASTILALGYAGVWYYYFPDTALVVFIITWVTSLAIFVNMK